MKPEVKEEWVKALRSGEYEQGEGFLCKNGRFCCLGVLIDVAVEGDWVLVEDSLGCGDYWALDGNSGTLPVERQQELGLSGICHGQLTAMNDDGISFAEIATWIERHV